MREARAARSSSAHIAYRRGILRPTPILTVRNGGRDRYIRPIETLLAWRISSGLYYDVISEQEARNIIGNQFEKYMLDLFQPVFPMFQVRGEVEYGSAKQRRKSPDLLVLDGNKLEILVECKTAKIPYTVQTSIEFTADHERVVTDLAKGITQICTFEADLIAGIDGVDISYCSQFIPIVVTLDDWFLIGRFLKDKVFEKAEELARQKGIPTKRITSRKMILCSAWEMDSILASYDATTIIAGLRSAMDTKFQDYMLQGAIAELDLPRSEQPFHPLVDRIDRFFAGITGSAAPSDSLAPARE